MATRAQPRAIQPMGVVSLQGNVLAGVIQTGSYVKREAGVAVIKRSQCLSLNQWAGCSRAQAGINLKMHSALQPRNVKQIPESLFSRVIQAAVYTEMSGCNCPSKKVDPRPLISSTFPRS